MSHLPLPDGGSLYFEVHGQGPPLVLVSGLGGLGSFWAPHMDILARHFTVVIHDHRGTGRSSRDPIDYSIEQMSGDVVALMDALDLDRVHFVGHSTGGAIGQHLALEHPERIQRLVLSATWPGPDPYVTALFELRAEVLRTSGIDLYNRLGALLTHSPDWIRDHGPPASGPAYGDASESDIIASRIQALLRFDRRPELARVDGPVLVICARDDAVIPAYCSEELAQCIPGARLTVLPDGGHFVPLTRPVPYRDHLLAFLRQS